MPNHRVFVDIPVGTRFDRWTVVGEATITRRIDDNGHVLRWITKYPCRCECGTERMVNARKLGKASRSCGCLTGEENGRRQLIHGHSADGRPSRLYAIWTKVKSRCCSPSDNLFSRYGGRGIRLCDDWRCSFESFLDWSMSHGYGETLEIDRIDNSGGYFPCNCRWTTPRRNKLNTSRNHFITAFGQTKTLVEWSEDPRCPVTATGLLLRLRRMPPELAISTPK